MGLMFGPESKAPKKSDLGYDPMVKDGDGASSHKVTIANVSVVASGKDGYPTRTNFFMAGVNANAVKRSNALLKYGEKVTYCEGMSQDGACSAYCSVIQGGFFGCAMVIAPTRWCLRKYCLPKPGEGPTEEQMAAGHLTVTGVARGVNGSKTAASFHFPTDPGYKDTARMLVESGLTFLLEKAFVCSGGVFTPACCQGETLLKRLVDKGSTWVDL